MQSENVAELCFLTLLRRSNFYVCSTQGIRVLAMVSLAQLRPSVLNAARQFLHRARLHENVIFSRPPSFRTTYGFSLAEEMFKGDDPVAPPLDSPPMGPNTYNPMTATKKEPKKDIAEPHKPYHLHVYNSHNNCRIVFTYPSGKLVKNGWWTSGSCGFKGANKSSYEAGYQCAVRAFKRIEEEIFRPNIRDGGISPVKLALKFKGFGWGREAVQKAFMTSEGDKIRSSVVTVEDQTPIKIGGTRAKKARRL